MAILFLFTITCSLTNVILAALTANVGSSFSIFYEPLQGYVLDEEAVNDITNAVVDVFYDYFEVNSILFDYNDPELSWSLNGGVSYDGPFKESGVIGHYGDDGNGIKWGYDNSMFIYSDMPIYAPEDSSSLFENMFKSFNETGLYCQYFLLNNFNTERVKIADKMFANAMITYINLIDADFSNVASANEMFDGLLQVSKVLINESFLTNENINNQTNNSEFYAAIHNDAGQIHMTKDSQFVLPAVDLSYLIGSEEGENGQFYTDVNFNGFQIPISGNGNYGVFFDNYTAPGEYINYKNKKLAENYLNSSNSLMVVAANFITTKSMFFYKGSIYTKGDINLILECPRLDTDTMHDIRLYFLYDEPIYIINAPEFVKNAEDWQTAILGQFHNKDDPDFHYSFNNFDTRFWG